MRGPPFLVLRAAYLLRCSASTLENWCREFQKFAPSINIQTYYADKKERPQLQAELIHNQRTEEDADGWEVLITTYQLASNEGDRKFMRRFDWEVSFFLLVHGWVDIYVRWQCCIFDEGHMLKNSSAERYKQLVKIPANWKVLLTGTPLQNNLQELVVSFLFSPFECQVELA